MRATDNFTLGVTEFGDPNGQPLVIAPGWATDHNFIEPIADLFKDFRVMLIDMPGYGKSSQLKLFSSSTRQTANLVLNTVPKDSILMSWSLSTLACCRAIAMDSENKISHYISVCGTPRFPADPNWPGFDYKYVVKCLKLFDEGRNSRSIKLFFKMQVQSNLLSKEQNEFLMNCFDKMGEIDTEVLKNGLLKMAYADHREAFNAIKIPSLHLFGAKDRLVNCDLASHMIAPPFHRCVVLSNSAHMPFLTEPEEFKKAVLLFLSNSSKKD
ncbi:MAG: alpha/beta fold hydrolase [Succinivibrio sp.]